MTSISQFETIGAGSLQWRAAALGAPANSSASLGSWLGLLATLLTCYALFGKGIAYLGVAPVYVGEIVLGLGLISMLYASPWHLLFYSPYAWLIIALGSWGAFRTIPYLPIYRFDALRDAVLLGYSVFALIVMVHLVAVPQRLFGLLRAYAKISLVFALVAPAVWVLGRVFNTSLPNWPWADVPLGWVKGGDILVHLAGVFAFWVAFPEQVYSVRLRFLGLLSIVIGVVAIGSETRAGFLAFGLVFGLCFLAYPRNRSLHGLMLAGVCAVLVLAATGVRVPIGQRERWVSFDQIATNFSSVFGGSHDDELDDSKTWRLQWWRDIVDYTLNGKYFWSGKGFGVNLADADGFQVFDDDELLTLRSPHNGHLNVLARSGVVGLTLWIAVLAAWAWGIVSAFFRARVRGQPHWAGLFLFLFCYWIVQVVNASFDVYLEGPVGGIWFWTVYGVGLAALWLYARQPELLEATEIGQVRYDR